MNIPIYQVDAFTDHVFGGNPAAVCPLESWLPDAVLQSIAMENNLAETAYVVRTGSTVEIRWFTPVLEINLCGHATLASAHVLFEHLGHPGDEIVFSSKSGPLRAARGGGLITLDFPAFEPEPIATPEALVRGLGRKPLETLRGRDILAVFGSEAEVAAIEPDFAAIRTLDCIGVIATAPGSAATERGTLTARSRRSMAAPGGVAAERSGVPAERGEAPAEQVDFVSRFFAPRAGVPEDPVTGSAHTLLVPFWAGRLGKTRFHAVQVSKRRGDLVCELKNGRVLMGGKAVTYLRGDIEV
jgi:predicted PhzF superfamily epimerase YddE/YHI9